MSAGYRSPPRASGPRRIRRVLPTPLRRDPRLPRPPGEVQPEVAADSPPRRSPPRCSQSTIRPGCPRCPSRACSLSRAPRAHRQLPPRAGRRRRAAAPGARAPRHGGRGHRTHRGARASDQLASELAPRLTNPTHFARTSSTSAATPTSPASFAARRPWSSARHCRTGRPHAPASVPVLSLTERPVDRPFRRPSPVAALRCSRHARTELPARVALCPVAHSARPRGECCQL